MPAVCALLFLFASCASAAVLNIPAGEAETLLKAGDIGFILDARLKKMGELARIGPQAPFYAGLLVEDYARAHNGDAAARSRARSLFENALKYEGTRVEAANKLIAADPDFYFEDFCRAAPRGRASATEGTRFWEAFNLLKPGEGEDAAEYAEAARAYFFSRDLSAPAVRAVDEWLYARMERDGRLPPDERDRAAVRARFACAARDWPRAYRLFREAFPPDAEDAAFPAALGRFPLLLGDFGRACQYGGGIAAGTALFAAYDEALKAAPAARPGAADARYRVNFYRGRLYRAAQAYDKALDAFETALALAPDAAQKDDCIWYILDVHYAKNPRAGVEAIKKYAPRWNAPANFDDIFEKFAYFCAEKKRWPYLLDMFPAAYAHGSQAARAKYAYIIARALEEGYLKTGMDGITSAALFAVAYEQESDYYYRVMAARRLDKEAPLPRLLPADDDAAGIMEENADMRFLLDFFRFGCARFAAAYANARYDALAVPQLRLLATRLNEAGRYGDSIRLVTKYGKRAGYEPARADLELSFPRAFRGLVEEYARKTRMREQYLYALMRTESIFIPDIVSPAGARGLTQLMPKTGRSTAEYLAAKGGPNYIENGEIDLLEPERNIHLGALYFKEMEQKMGSVQAALLAYNGGIGRVRRLQKESKSLPDDLFAEAVEMRETREYSKKVIAGAAIYDLLYY